MCFIYLNKLVWIIISFIDRFDDVSIYLLLKKKKSLFIFMHLEDGAIWV